MLTTSQTPFYRVGGSLPPDAPSYVARRADGELLEALRRDELCYVLDARQVGKSSLMVRAADALRRDGRPVAVLDLSAGGISAGAEQSYTGLLYSLGDQTRLGPALEQAWDALGALGPAQRWFAAVQRAAKGRRLVIFVDEIDAVRRLPFDSDEFFAAIRECHNRQAYTGAQSAATFCLLGVASPFELVADVRSTPFNVGRRITLHDFTPEEAAPLAAGFAGQSRCPEAALRRVLHWTGGHPYLTQRLCAAVAAAGTTVTARAVDRACHQTLLTAAARDDDVNLASARRVLTEGHPDVAAVLQLYRAALRGKARTPEDHSDPVAATLALSGVVKAERGTYVVRNRIYAATFNEAWVRQHMPDAERRRQRTAIRRGALRASLLWLALVLLLLFGYSERRRAHDAALTARISSKRAEHSRGEARRLGESIAALTTSEQRLLRENQHAQTTLHEAQSRYRETLRQQARITEDLWAARRQTASEKARVEKAANTIGSMSGKIASAFALRPESGYEALEFGLQAVRLARNEGRRPSEPAVQGLVDAVGRHVFRRFVLNHDAPVSSLAFSPNGYRLLTAGKGRYAYLWSTETGRLDQRLRIQDRPGVHQMVNTTEFSPDGRLILIASDEKGVSLWDATNRMPLQTRPAIAFPKQNVPVQCAAFSGDGRYVAMLAENRNVLLYEISTGQTRLLCHDPESLHTKFLWTVAFSRTGKYLVTTSEDGSVKVWDVSGALLTTDTRHRDADLGETGTLCATFSESDDIVISAGKDGFVRLWFWKTGVLYRKLVGHRDWVWHVSGSPSNFFISSAGRDRCVNLWAFSGDQNPLYTIASHLGQVYCARFSPNLGMVATASEDHTAQVWQFRNNLASTTGAAMTYAEYSCDGRMVLSTSADGYTRVERFARRAGPVSLIGTAPANHAAFSRDGALLAVAEQSGTIRSWDPHVGAGDRRDCIRSWSGHKGPVRGLAYAPDGRSLASAGQDGVVRLWHSRTGQLIREMRGHQDGVQRIAFSADGSVLLSASLDGSAALWDVSSGTVLQRFLPAARSDATPSGSVEHLRDVAFSPDERLVVTADANGFLHVYDRATGRPIRHLRVHAGDAFSLHFNRTGTRIATSGGDGRVHVWDAAQVLSRSIRPSAVRPVLTITTHVNKVISVRFSPDGETLVTASRDNTCRLFPATVDGYVRQAHEILRLRPGRPRPVTAAAPMGGGGPAE